jgi:F-type H+-transporting ATPase subunit b
MPQLDPSHFPSQIFWLVIAFSLLYLYLKHRAVPSLENIISNRASKIEADSKVASNLQQRISLLKEQCAQEARQTKDDVAKIHDKVLKDFSDTKHERLAAVSENFSKEYSKLAAKVTKEKMEAMEKIPSAASELALLIINKATGVTHKIRER